MVQDVVGLNPVDDIPVSFTAQPGLEFVDGVDDCVTGTGLADPGTCSVQVTSRVVGSYQVGATISSGGVETDLSNSPVTVEFEAGPICLTGCDPVDPSHLTRVEVVKNGAKPDGQDRDQIRVWAFDSAGNPKVGAQVTAVTADADLTVQPDIARIGADGSTTVWFTSLVAGSHVADVRVDGLVPSGSPVTLGFGSGLGDPDHSSFTVAPEGPLTVGSGADSTYTLTATVHDVFDQPVNGDVVTFKVDPAGPQFARGELSCITVDGFCQVSLFSTVSGTYSVAGSLARGPLGQAQSVAWRADAVCSEAAGCVPDPNVPAEQRTRVEVTKNDRVADGSTPDEATVHVFDQWGNAVPGALITSTTQEADLRILPGIPGTNDQGLSQVDYTSRVAGSYQAEVFADGFLVTGSPVGLSFKAGPICLPPMCEPDPGVANDRRSRVVVDPDRAVADGVSEDLANVFLFDRLGNPVSGASVRLSTDDTELILPTTPVGLSGTDGRASFGLRSAVAGGHVARAFVQVAGQEVEVAFAPQPGVPAPADYQSSPFTAAFQFGQLSESRSSLVLSPKTQVVGAEVEATLSANDQSGNPVTGLTASEIVLDADGLTVVSGPVERSPGRYVYVLTTTVAASYEVSAQVGSVTKSDSVRFVATAVDPNRSGLSVTPSSQTVGQNVVVTVTAQDVHGNPVLDLTAADFAIVGLDQSAVLPDLTGVDFMVNADGSYSFNMTSLLAGQFTVQATVQAVQVVQRPAVSFVAGGVCVTNCDPQTPGHVTRVEMVVNDQLADGSSADKAQLWAFDTYGNPVAGAQVEATASNSADLRPQINSVRTGADGTAELLWTSFQQGVYTAEVLVSGLRPDTGILNQIRFTQTQPSADLSELQVTPAGPLEVGQSYIARATVRDAQGTLLSDITVSFSAELVESNEPNPAAQLSDSTCLTGADGSCAVGLTAQVAGVYNVRATVPVLAQATEIQNSPTPVTFRPGPACVSNCQPVDPARVTRVEVTKNGVVPDGTQADEATVYVHDTYGNAVPGAAVVTTTADPELILLTPDATTGPDGTAVLRYASLRMGTHVADLRVVGQRPTGAPVSLLFSTDQGDPSQSRLVVSPAGPLTVGAVYTITANVFDAVGLNPINDIMVDFTAPSEVSFIDGQDSCVTAGSGAQAGTCSVQVSARQAGSYLVTAVMPGVGGAATGLSNSPVTVVFEAGEVCVTDCQPLDPTHLTRVELIRNGVKPDGQEHDLVRVWAYDEFGNPVPGRPVASTTADSGLIIQPAASLDPTGPDGSTTIWYASTVAGNHSADVSVSGQTPAGSPVTLGFGAGLGDPNQSSFSIDPAGPLTAGAGPGSLYTATAQVRDVFGAPVTGDVVTFSIDPAGPLFSDGEFSCLTVDGTCQVSFYSTVAGTYSVAAALARGPLPAQSRAWLAGQPCSEAAGCLPVDPNLPADRRTRVEVTVNHQAADGSTPDIAIASVFDRWGNPVPGALITSTAQDSALRVLPGIPGTDGEGVSVIRYTSQQVGTYQAEVWVDGLLVTGSPVSLSFVPGPVCLAPDCVPDPDVPNDRRSRVVVEPDGQLADGQSQDVVHVYLFDRQGNPVPGQTVLQSSQAPLVVQSEAIALSDDQGETTIAYTSLVDGAHQGRLHVIVGGLPVELTFTPQPVPPADGPAPANYQGSPFTVIFATVPATGATIGWGAALAGLLAFLVGT
ncbi:MAG: Ig-like domain-containing protein, partial [Propionibacteriaceae bacterium]|nr:Ig-like domain-containing protein [Propionibacteriaceae bacterium]